MAEAAASYHRDQDVYHYTRIADYLACPARELCRREGEPSVATPEMLRGKHVHEGLERYGRLCFEHRRKVMEPEGLRIAAGYPGETGKIIADFVKVARFPWGRGGEAEALGVETRLEATLPNGATFAGRIDLLYHVPAGGFMAEENDRNWWVLDWKTHAPQWCWSPDPDRQLLWYAWLVQQVYGAELFTLAVGAMFGYRQWQTFTWPRRDPRAREPLVGKLTHIGEELAGLVDRMVADRVCEPNLGSCGDCTYRLSCPERNTKARGIAAEDGEMLLRLYLYHQGQADQFKALLHPRVAGHGQAVEVGEVGYGLGKPPQGYKVRDPLTFATGLQRLGLSWQKVFGDPTKSEVQKAAKELPEAKHEEFLALFETTEGTPRVGLYKVKPANGEVEAASAPAPPQDEA